MEFFLPSFLAGVLTILAPCILSLLPIILGGTLTEKNPWRPLTIAMSLGISVVLFTLLLKATTFLISVPDVVWQSISGILVMIIGLSMVFPDLWDQVGQKLKFYKTENILAGVTRKEGIWGSVVLGAAMGPVFTTCSPTYGIILATVLPANFFIGTINLLLYAFGLTLMLLAIGYGGRTIVQKIRFAANPGGWLKRGLGVILVLTGIMIITGFNKYLETKILDSGYNGPIEIEKSLMKN